jgi:triosephosphate isomerase (TIM)
MIIINFKDYEESTGENAVSLAKVYAEVVSESGAKVAIAVHPTDLRAVVSEVGDSLMVLSQTGDSYTRGSDGSPKGTQTGRMTSRTVSRAGGKGILVNHAENPRTDEEIRAIVADFKSETPETLVVVCAESVERAESIMTICAESKPDFVAIEPPDMIGGDVSVTTKPEIIEDAVAKIGDNVLVGAGVKTGDDVAKALELGAKGVLLASGVIKPKNGKTPAEALSELTKAL